MLGGYPSFLYANVLGCSPIPHSGISTWMVNLCEHLSVLEGIDLHVVSEIYPPDWVGQFRSFRLRKIGKFQSFTSGRITYHFLTPLPRLRTATLFMHDCFLLHKIIREINPDIVHAHHTDEFALAAVTSGYPSIITVHGIFSRERKSVMSSQYQEKTLFQ